MTTSREEVLKLSEQAGFGTKNATYIVTELTKLIDLAKQQQREADVELCDSIASDNWSRYKGQPPYTGFEDGRADQFVAGKSAGAELCSQAIHERVKS